MHGLTQTRQRSRGRRDHCVLLRPSAGKCTLIRTANLQRRGTELYYYSEDRGYQVLSRNLAEPAFCSPRPCVTDMHVTDQSHRTCHRRLARSACLAESANACFPPTLLSASMVVRTGKVGSPNNSCYKYFSKPLLEEGRHPIRQRTSNDSQYLL